MLSINGRCERPNIPLPCIIHRYRNFTLSLSSVHTVYMQLTHFFLYLKFFQEPGIQPYRKVAVVEQFFDIIYNVHVGLGGRSSSRHAGQKRTYRTVSFSKFCLKN